MICCMHLYCSYNLGGTGNVLLHLKHSDSILLCTSRNPPLHASYDTIRHCISLALNLVHLFLEALGVCYFLTLTSWQAAYLRVGWQLGVEQPSAQPAILHALSPAICSCSGTIQKTVWSSRGVTISTPAHSWVVAFDCFWAWLALNGSCSARRGVCLSCSVFLSVHVCGSRL